MATVVFSSFIQGYARCPEMEAPGNSVREVLENYFQEFLPVRSYIFDDQGCIRPRLAVFVDGVVVEDRIGLTDPVHLHARVFVQAMPIDLSMRPSDGDECQRQLECLNGRHVHRLQNFPVFSPLANFGDYQ